MALDRPDHPLKDVRVRQAVSLAIDRQGTNEALTQRLQVSLVAQYKPAPDNRCHCEILSEDGTILALMKLRDCLVCLPLLQKSISEIAPGLREVRLDL